MPGREHFILADILDVVVRHIELLHVQVLLAVVPLDLNHRLAGLLLAPALLDDPNNAADNRALLRLPEEGKLADAVYHASEHELTVDGRSGPRSHCCSLCLCLRVVKLLSLLLQLLYTLLTRTAFTGFVDAFRLREHLSGWAICCCSSCGVC